MVKFPAALSIALWPVLSLWAVRIISYIFDLPSEYFWMALVVGSGAALFEWQLIKARQH
jgi:hypothetical protein